MNNKKYYAGVKRAKRMRTNQKWFASFPPITQSENPTKARNKIRSSSKKMVFHCASKHENELYKHLTQTCRSLTSILSRFIAFSIATKASAR